MSDNEEQRRHVGRITLYAGMMLAFIYAALGYTPFLSRLTATGRYLDFGLRATTVALLIWILFVRFRAMRVPSEKPAHEVRQPNVDNAKELQVTAADLHLADDVQAAVFALAVMKPRALRQRVVESYELGARVLHQRVSIEGTIPRYLLPHTNGTNAKVQVPEFIYFPVLLPSKGKFQDNFSLYDASGQAVLATSYREYLQLSAIVLRMILASALRSRARRSLPDTVKDAELKALKLIQARRGNDGKIPGTDSGPLWHELLDPDPQDLQARQANKAAVDFVNKLSEYYATVAIIRPDQKGRFFVKYEQTLIPDLKLTFRRRLSIILGSRPVELTLDLKNASTAESFHLRVNAPDGIYLGDQDLLDAKKTLESTAQDLEIPPHFRFRRRLGQPHAHFYTRYFPEPAVDERPKVRLKYFEVPPGSLLRAVVSSVACLLLVWIIGFVMSRHSTPGTDAPAILLAFPALVAAWLGFETPSRRLLEGTLAARLSLIGTVVTSVCASGLFMAQRALTESPYHWWRLGGSFGFFWINDVAWASIVLVAFVNAFVVSYLYAARVALFARLSSRTQGGDGE